MKVADLIALLAPLSERSISLRHGPLLMDLERESLRVLDDENAAFEMPGQPAPPAPTLADALGVVANWMKQAEERIAALEENGSTGDIDYSELAGEIDLSDLADEIDLSNLADHIDIEDTVNESLRYARFRLE